MLMAGFTTVQSIGAASTCAARRHRRGGCRPAAADCRYAAQRRQPDARQVRAHVRKAVADGADVIKILPRRAFARRRADAERDQINAGCEKPRRWATGLVHAQPGLRGACRGARRLHPPSPMAPDHRCEADLMAKRGTYFEPQTGLLLQNYLENKAPYMGIGNYNDAGFKFMEEGIPLTTPCQNGDPPQGPEDQHGTDAVAAPWTQRHEIIHRVQVGGQGTAMPSWRRRRSMPRHSASGPIGTLAPGWKPT